MTEVVDDDEDDDEDSEESAKKENDECHEVLEELEMVGCSLSRIPDHCCGMGTVAWWVWWG